MRELLQEAGAQPQLEWKGGEPPPLSRELPWMSSQALSRDPSGRPGTADGNNGLLEDVLGQWAGL